MTLLGKTIGNFRVIDLLGEGGMGEVYVGFDERLKRKVALKAIRGDRRFDDEIKTRFMREAEILSKLEHPNICRIYDLLETEYADILVLELIKGRTLNNAQIYTLSDTEKLRIAIQLGEVLSDAHAHSVVHRDLKPENVMIDDRGQVKVLDFGLAHSIIDQNAATKIWTSIAAGDFGSDTVKFELMPGGGFKTEHGAIIGTPMYMSPEQAHCKPATAASDMYSYGLLLQWLFTGKHPYPADISPVEIFIKAGNGESLPADGVEDNLRRLIDRLKAVDPTFRPTAMDTVERLKWIEEAPRRRAKKITNGVIIGALSVGIILSGFGLYRAKRSERLERIARNRQEKMSEFLVDMWISPSPMERGRDVKVVDVLAYGKEKVEKEFGDDPELKAALLNHLGTTYRRLGEYDKAESIMTECLEYSKRTLGPDHTRTITVMIDLGIIFSYGERFQEAEALFRDALVSGRKYLEPENENMIYAKEEMASILMGKAEYSEAEVLLREVLSTIRGDDELMYKFGPKVLLDLGHALMYKEDFPGAEKIFLELLDDYEKKGDTDNPNYIAAKGAVAQAFMEQNKHDEGLRYMREGVELSMRVNGERSRNTIALMINLGQVLNELGQYEEALSYTEHGYNLIREVFGERAPATAFVSVNYADLLRELGRVDEAEPILNQAISLDIELLGTEHPNTLLSQLRLAVLLFESDRNLEAEALTRSVLETSTRVLGAEKQMTLECKDLLGRILNRKGDYAQAEKVHREVLETRISTLGDKDSSMSNTLLYLAESLYRQGKNGESCRYAEQALRSHFETFGGDHPGTGESASFLVKVFTESGKADRADSLLESMGLKLETE